jgi:uncharacterized protein YjbI with pentapeptide repeats
MANLAGASLSRAGLREANLYEMNLIGAKADSRTQWPEDFDPRAAGVIFVDEPQPEERPK